MKTFAGLPPGDPSRPLPVRLPAKRAGEVEAFVRKAKRKMPPFFVGKSSKAQ